MLKLSQLRSWGPLRDNLQWRSEHESLFQQTSLKLLDEDHSPVSLGSPGDT